VTVFHIAQLILAALVVGLAIVRLHDLLGRAPIHRETFLSALLPALRERDESAALDLTERARPAWLGRVGSIAILAYREGQDAEHVEEALEAELADLKYEAGRGLMPLRGLASVASATALLGVIIEVIDLLQGERGLDGLMAGRAEQRAAEHAMLSMAIGMGTAVFAVSALRLLRRWARSVIVDAQHTARVVSEALVAEPDRG
jgi:biopolymer transport protein ExbB/TolQ